MGIPTVCTVLTCPSCGSDQVRFAGGRGGTAVQVECVCRHRFPHPSQAFARDLVRGRERIVVGPRR